MGKVIPTAKAFGVNLDNVTTSYAELTAKGIATSEAGTYVASMFNELGKQGTNASKALKDVSGKTFQELIGSGKSLGDILAIMDAGAKKNNKSLADMFGSAEAGKAAMIIATNSGKDFNDMLAQMKQSAGATQTAFNKMDATPAERMAKSINKSKNEMIRLGQNLLPMLDDISGMIGKVADYFGKMTTEEQQAIIKTTLFVATFGTGLKVIGGMTSGLGSLVGGIGKVSATLGSLSKASKVAKEVEGLAVASEGASVGLVGLSSALIPIGATLAVVGAGVYTYNQYQDALTKSSITSREEMGLLKTTLLELNGVHVQSQAELEKSGVRLKELGDNLGEDFKNKINESTKSMQDFSFYLSEINMDKTLTEEETKGFNDRVKNMFDEAIKSIQEKQKTTQDEMGKTFLLDDNKIDENEQKVLDYLNKNYNTNIEEVTKLRNDINEIYKGALDDKRSLNEQEVKDIQDKMSKIKEIELEALANNEEEKMFAKNEFINRMNTLDAEGAKTLLTQKKQQLDDQNSQTLASYDTQIETMKLASEKAEGVDKENLEKEIAIKTEQRDKLLEKQKETWQGYIDIVEEKNPELAGKINKYNGTILSDADLNSQQMLEKFKSTYDGLDKITESGWYTIRDKTTGALQNTYVEVDKTTGDIVGSWNNCTKTSAGYTADLDNKVREVGKTHADEQNKISSALITLAGSWSSTSGQIIGHGGNIIGTMHDVTTSTDGVKQGIIDVNGTPISIKTNANGVITEINGVKTGLDEIPEKKGVEIKFIQTGLDWIKKTWDSITSKNVSVDRKATGTNNYQGGLSTVSENGWELASNNNVRMLGSYNSNPLAYIPNGTGIRTHMQSVSDMKYEISKQLNSIMLSGGYYNKNSAKAKQLVNNYNNNYSGAEIDYNKLANVMLNVITQGLSNVNTIINVDVDANGMVNKSVDKTMDRLNRQNRNNKVSKGRG